MPCTRARPTATSGGKRQQALGAMTFLELGE